MNDVPIRIGDADRDRAIERLRTAMAEGRLTYEEFDQRVEAALQAKYQRDLEPLFGDLPPVHRPDELAPVEVRSPMDPFGGPALPPGRRYHRTGFYLPLWPMTFVILVASGWRLWWVVLIPLVLAPIIMGGQRRGPGDRHDWPPRHP